MNKFDHQWRYCLVCLGLRPCAQILDHCSGGRETSFPVGLVAKTPTQRLYQSNTFLADIKQQCANLRRIFQRMRDQYFNGCATKFDDRRLPALQRFA
jgi:hypothetical protein